MKERLTWLRIPSQAGGMRQFRWIPQLFAMLCAVCANQFAFSHNRKASSNGSLSFFLTGKDFYPDYIYDVLVLNHR